MQSLVRDPREPASAWILLRLCVALMLLAGSTACRMQGPDAIEVEVRGVGVDPSTNVPVLFLQDKGARRGLPVWIGPNEASVIRMELEHIEPVRPLTHDLLVSILEELDATVERIIVEDLKDTTYIASLVIRAGGRKLVIDCRPSDAVAVALKCKAPLFVSRHLLEKGLFVQLDDRDLDRQVEQRYGVVLQDISPSIARYFDVRDAGGVIVTEVKEGSPAQAAGLLRGDIIRSVDGTAVSSSADLRALLSERSGLEPIELEVFRTGRTYRLFLKGQQEDTQTGGPTQ